MTDVEMIELARAYVALSNAHRLQLIGAMFDKNSVYTSSALGQFHGAIAIAEMMTGFFARYPDVHWYADNYRNDDSWVKFDFTMTAGESGSGESLKRAGSEKIKFDQQGFISRLEVHVS